MTMIMSTIFNPLCSTEVTCSAVAHSIARTYRIGGWEAYEAHADIDLLPFWIARYPTTMAQYQAFMAAGGYDEQDWWMPLGWQWRQENQRTKPFNWDNQTTQESVNQPVYGVTWYEARAFCGWLDRLLAAEGYAVRLPTYAEWEAVAAYAATGERFTYPWGMEELTPERAIYDEHALNDHPASVGTCPAGAAASSALDMAGNVREWTQSYWWDYPNESGIIVTDTHVGGSVTNLSLRGGSYENGSTDVRCAARSRNHPGYGFIRGFRCGVAPRSP